MGRIRCLLLFFWVWNSASWVAGLDGSLGTDFITAYMQNYGSSGKFELQITGHHDLTTVTVNIPCDVCENQSKFLKKIVVNKGMMVQVILPAFVEAVGTKLFSEVIHITADKEISVVSMNSKPYTTELALLYPVNSLGRDYYVVTPSAGPQGTFPEFSVFTRQGPNVITIYLKAQVNFNGKTYSAGSKLTVTLNDFQGIQLQGAGDLSGTRIVSQEPVAVLSGHVCSWRYTKCNHVVEQLQPVSSWGKTFMAPPLPWQTKNDILYVSASQSTVLTYQIGANKQVANLEGGQVLQILVLPGSAVYLSASSPVQVHFYSTGAKFQTFNYDTLLMEIPDADRYSRVYTVNRQDGFQNFVFLVAKTTEVNGLMLNDEPLVKVQWNSIPGTEYSWGKFELPLTTLTYRVVHPESPFCLLIVGIANQNSYGIPGAALESAPTLSCDHVKCQKGMECKMINGQPKCVPLPESTCWAWGDPHYHTFDGRNFDFQGTCTYTISKTTDYNVGLPFFHIYAKNENRGNTRVSYVGMVILEVYGFLITMIRSEIGFVRVNGILTQLPISLNGGTLWLAQSGTSVIITTAFQLKVSYDWNHHLRITINSAYYGAVSGLCGNNNGNPEDDFQTPSGTLVPDAIAFGESWWLEGKGDTCWHDCHGPCQPCQPDLVQKYGSEIYCGQITLSNGPFSACHAKVSPTSFFESCVFDVCANEGHRPTLCDALKAYADACQREGVQVGEWRRTARCPLECPPNSEYQLCGTPCPATCVDDLIETQQFCPAVCVEGCQCIEGFVLSQGICIPRSSCGCYYEGRHYAPNERFWADDQCLKRCVCNPATRQVECASSACKASEKCEVQKGVRDCYPISYGNCSATGDPHYLTFDNRRYDFQGPCAYVLTEVSPLRLDLTWFGVYVQNEYRGNRHVTWTQSVQVNVYEVEIVISRQYPGKILVGGLLTFLPYSSAGGRVKVFKQGYNAVIQTNFGLSVSFNWDSHVSVMVPSTYAGILHGLCGNFNGNREDDALVPGTILVPSIPVFGSTKEYDSKCNEVIDPKCPGLEAIAEEQRASGKDCGLIISPNGPFRECHAHIDPDGAFWDCIYDYCFSKGRYVFTCAGISTYATACQTAGITIYPWRSSTFCPLPCPLNSHYEVCAKECGQSCSSLYVQDPCPAKCSEDCVCNEGYIKSHDACVPIAQCGCFHQGQYYPALEYFYPSCEERCQCQAGGQVLCEVVHCSPDEECKLVDGLRKCHPIGNATCSVIGSLYLTFDQRSFNFQGTCTYTLAKLQEKNVDLTPITVVVENEAWLNGENTVIKLVRVQISGIELTLLRNKAGSIMVDGIFHYLPVNLLNGQIRIYQHGLNIMIQSSFGFALSYDLFYHLRITVPSTYKGHMRGLCGNYNGQQDDDLQLPDGSIVSDVAAFAAAWKILVPGVSCTDGCSGTSCPICGKEKEELFKQRSSCGILTASDGPFQACHALVDPTVYLNNCVFELCINGEDKEPMCQTIESYVTACQEAGVNVQTWRSPTFCPLTCPANSHYAICSNICETNCAGITDHLPCPESCAEGCQCDDGFFFDGLKCVSLDECGCFENNRYFPPNEAILLNNCSEKCICSPAGGVICEANTCSEDETCVVKDGILQCKGEPPLSCDHVTCQKGTECKIIDGQPKCVPLSNSTCWAWGDPHYHTFDGRNFDFQGTCTYTISKTTDYNVGLPFFHIYAKNENRGNTHVSYVGMVTLEVYGFLITMIRSEIGFVRVNGILTQLPISLNGGTLWLAQSGTSVIITTAFQLKVSYDWNHHLRITINSAYYGAVSGLCGNNNGNPEDDFQTPSGTLVPDAIAFGESWWLEGKGDTCWHDCHGPCQPCQPDLVQKYGSEIYCGQITLSNGPFSACHAKVSPTSFFESCVFDVCANEGHRPTLCDALKAYADACQREGVQVGEWRRTAGCPLECPPNSEYQLCGTACPATCVDDLIETQQFCPAVCVEGCQCIEGFVLSQGICIPRSSCGCYYEGRHYAPNERFWADDQCLKRCVCNSGTRQVECAPSACKASEKCEVQKGVRDCYPISYGNCSATGDPHYLTFDNRRYDFQGPCAYVLTEVSPLRLDLTWFGVYVQNEYRGNRHVTWTQSVQVNVYEVEIVISRQYPGKILVGGLLTFLPYSSAGGRVKAFKQGHNAVIQTNFGLSVSFNWDSHVSVTVPSTYAGILHGLCGNFNGNREDDALVPGTILVPSIPVFGSTKEYDSKCNEVIDPKCPGLEAIAEEQRASGKDCGLIISPNGPFRECHAHIDPDGAFWDCIYDYCFSKGRYAFICAGISTYATACQTAGITIYPWRSSTFCPLPCPLNSHYEVCAKECGQSCSSLYVPDACPAKCKEDCVCNEGYIKSNDACVPIAQCGCFYRGQYYPALEYFYPSCEERCQCQAGGQVGCVGVSCGPGEECKLVDGLQKCHPTGSATCSVIGSHYLTFDQRPFNLQGTCTYILAKLQENLTPITVVVENEAWLNGENTVVKLVRVQISGIELTLLRNKVGSILVDGVFHRLPLNLLNGQIRIYQHGLNIMIQSSFGFALSYDLFYHLRITVPSTYKGHMRGLCGNYNGQQDDDLQLPDGSVVSDVVAFAAAWKILVPGVSCTDGCSGTSCPICGKEKEELFKQRSSCGILTASDGPFQACHALVDPTVYLNNCVFELCISGGDKEPMCRTIQSYVTACQEAGVNIEPWRISSFCPLTCPANSHYTICSNICETNCAGLMDHLPCPESCAEGCQCDDGFFFDGLRCISLDECGCFEHNRYFLQGESYLSPDCKRRFTCQYNGSVTCEPGDCAAGEVCELRDGLHGCFPIEGHCTLMPGAHLSSFDGLSGDVLTPGTFQLASLCDISSGDWFRVVVEVASCPPDGIVAPTLIHVFFKGIFISVNGQNEAWVNGLPVSIPHKATDLVTLSLVGHTLLLRSPQVQVSLSLAGGVRVTINPALSGRVCGTCGNFNYDRTDDLKGPGGVVVESVRELLISWIAKDFTPCLK